MKSERMWLRITGLAGMLGGLIFAAGDMLYYYNAHSADIFANMGSDSDTRIMLASMTALVGTWLYVAGVAQVFIAFKPATAAVRNTVAATFVAIFIAYGVVHSAYVAIATSAKLAAQHGLDMDAATALALHTNTTLRLFIYPVFAVLSYFFITRVWKHRTLYPRWIILFFPLIPLLFHDVLDQVLTGHAWLLIVGTYLNMIVVVFYAASTIALWSGGTERPDRPAT